MIVLIIAAAIIAVIAMGDLMARPTQPPAVEDIVPRSHAVEKHGQDAVTARSFLQGCKIPMVRPCGKKGWVYWCETGGNLCPGSYVTAGAIEVTTFWRPCKQWRNCK